MDDKFIQLSFRKRFESDPEYYGRMLKLFKKNETWVQAQNSDKILIYPYFCQLWAGNNRTNIEEDLIVANIWQQILRDEIIYTIQQTPRCFKDKEIAENKELFKSYKYSCIDSDVKDADFWGGNQGEDGFIEFKKPLMKINTWFPLEVGYVRPTQMEYHLQYKGCVARLPYESDYIIYFERISIYDLPKHSKVI